MLFYIILWQQRIMYYGGYPAQRGTIYLVNKSNVFIAIDPREGIYFFFISFLLSFRGPKGLQIIITDTENFLRQINELRCRRVHSTPKVYCSRYPLLPPIHPPCRAPIPKCPAESYFTAIVVNFIIYPTTFVYIICVYIYKYIVRYPF